MTDYCDDIIIYCLGARHLLTIGENLP